jgi:hypothetical protein
MADRLFKDNEKKNVAKTQSEKSSAEAQNDNLVKLQQFIGNSGVQRVLGQSRVDMPQRPAHFIQTKLTVGAADDQYEQEADSVAKDVMKMPDTAQRAEEDELMTKRDVVQRAEEDELMTKRDVVQRAEEDELMTKRDIVQRAEEDELMTKRDVVQRAEEDELMTKRDIVQRAEEDELMTKHISTIQRAEEDELMTKRAEIQRAEEVDPMGSFEVDNDIEGQISSTKGSGQALPDTAKGFFENRFQQDFSGVNVHTGSEADTLNRSLSARAFTTGSDIYFRSGEYQPDNSSGRELLAHELTHVVQQTGGKAQMKREEQA